MQQKQEHKSEGLSTDYLAWRIMNAKRREKETKRNKEYNLRPRLRSELHH